MCVSAELLDRRDAELIILAVILIRVVLLPIVLTVAV